MADTLAVIGALHLCGLSVENPARNAAGDLMFDLRAGHRG